jgi:predicted nucleotidyltransferase
MIYGVKEENIRRINQVFINHPEVDEVILYGSRAKGSFKPASDIDLTLKGDHLDSAILSKIAWEIDDLLLPFTFDLSVYSQIQSKELLSDIQRIGIVFYLKTNIRLRQ